MTIRPLVEITGHALFNEVFLDDAVVDDADLIGGVNNGWAVTQTTLMFERAGIGAGGIMSGFPPAGPKGGFLPLRAGDAAQLRPPGSTSKVLTVDELFELARSYGRDRDPLVRQKLARLVEYARTGEWTAKRSVVETARGGGAGLANVGKLAQTRIAKLSTEIACDILGPAATLWDPDGPRAGRYAEALVFAAASSIYGGTDQIQRNVIGERALGLPREPDPNKGVSFREVQESLHAATANADRTRRTRTMGVVARAHDLLVNTDMGDTKQPEWMVRVKEDYFKAGESMFTSRELPELLDEMDRMGVERSVLMTNLARPSKRVLSFVDERPDRFSIGLGGHNLLRPMENLRALEGFVADHQVAYTVVGPSFWGDGMYPPSDAVYYPLYTKCCELELPLCMNTGLPGPPIPGEVQNPIHLDRVCVRFPELKLCMMHGADPWWDVAIRLMIKYANLRLMTSAWSPRHLPQSLLHFMSTRGKNRVMFASETRRCCRSRGASTKRRRWSSRPRCSTRTCTGTPKTSSSPRETPGVQMTASEESLRVQLEQNAATHVARITIDNPERRNAYDPAMRRQMAAYLDELAVDDDIKVVILRGSDGVFSTGADMENSYTWYAPGESKRRPSQRRRLGVDRESFGFYHDYLTFPKVTIAQVETYALGGGFELALMSDLAVVGRDAQLGMPGAQLSARARQPAPLLLPARPGAGPAPAPHRRHRQRAELEHLGLVHRGLRSRLTWRERTEDWAAQGRADAGRRPGDRQDRLQSRRADSGYVGEEATGFLMHAFATNLRFEDDEFNFVKTRAKHGTSEAFRLRDEHFAVAGRLTREQV